MSDKKSEVLETLGVWIVQIANNKELATPEEIEALPKVAEVFFKYYSSVPFSPVRKEYTSSKK